MSTQPAQGRPLASAKRIATNLEGQPSKSSTVVACEGDSSRMDPEMRKSTLRMLTNGVYILTSRNKEKYGGATVTWVSQASFQPPLLMAAVRQESNVFRCMKESKIAALHILAPEQEDVAQRFFTPTSVRDGHMNGQPFTEGKTSVPVLEKAPAYVECRVVQIIDDIGDHAIVIMEVVEAKCRRRVDPMTIAKSPWQYGG